MESIQPAPDGTRYEGYDVNLAFWQAMAADRVNHFEVEDTVVMGDRANIRWRFHFGDGGSVRGVSLIRVRDGRIVEALAYAKTPVNRRRCLSDRCSGLRTQMTGSRVASTVVFVQPSLVHHRPRARDRRRLMQ